MSWLSFAHKEINVKDRTIDPDYTGNINMILYNWSNENYIIQPDDKIIVLVNSRIVEINE